MNEFFMPYSYHNNTCTSDKTCRYMRCDQFRSKYLHYFNMFATQDRVPLSELSVPQPVSLSTASHVSELLLPSLTDDKDFNGVNVLVSCIITKHLPFFNTLFKDVVQWHIEHQYSKEMCKTSTIVSK